MTGNDKVTLKYSLDKSNILTTYADGLDFTDVILVSDEHKHYKVYKFILSACSPVLKQVLMENQHNEPLIYLNGVKDAELKYLLQILYYGTVTLPNIHLDKLIEVIEEFKLIGLKLPTVSDNHYKVHTATVEAFNETIDNFDLY